jgi:hypothetical protein
MTFKIYTGQDALENSDFTASESVVLELANPFLEKGYTLYLDNWYSSPNLFLELNRRKTNVLGTVRSNRRNMPKDLVNIKLKKGEVATQSSRGLLALKWKDKKDVYFLSSKHKNANMTDTGKKQRKKKGGEQEENVIKPKCILEYNKGMGGVDRHDQVLASFPVMRRFVKGYRKMAFYMMDIAIFNSYVIYKKLKKGNNDKRNYVDYRVDLAEQILENVTLPEYGTRGRQSHGDTPTRLQAKTWAHFPRNIPPTEKKKNPTRACRVCASNKKRSETTWECDKCLVALHVPECFRKYHTLQKY